MRIIAALCIVGMTAACAPYEAAPASVYQWDRRQEAIEREYQAQVERCRAMDRDSEAFARDCANLREFRQ